MHEVLQEPAKIQQSFSSAKFPTVWRTLPLLGFLQQSWMNMAARSKFASMASSINAGLENLEKWYRKTDETDFYFICLALDPNYKTAYAEHNWAPEFFDEGMAKMEAKFDSYYTPPAVAFGGPEPELSAGSVQYGHSWMRAAVKSRRAEDNAKADPREEQKAYLCAPLETTDDVGWWGVESHTVRHLPFVHFRCWDVYAGVARTPRHSDADDRDRPSIPWLNNTDSRQKIYSAFRDLEKRLAVAADSPETLTRLRKILKGLVSLHPEDLAQPATYVVSGAIEGSAAAQVDKPSPVPDLPNSASDPSGKQFRGKGESSSGDVEGNPVPGSAESGRGSYNPGDGMRQRRV
ncbi:hypothetical protein FB451DRAFT_1376010 [Mycena latifolia]|nr:hypothetical protein FB451DRAFT_1376010 [Mycena latifolia]